MPDTQGTLEEARQEQRQANQTPADQTPAAGMCAGRAPLCVSSAAALLKGLACDLSVGSRWKYRQTSDVFSSPNFSTRL